MHFAKSFVQSLHFGRVWSGIVAFLSIPSLCDGYQHRATNSKPILRTLVLSLFHYIGGLWSHIKHVHQT